MYTILASTLHTHPIQVLVFSAPAIGAEGVAAQCQCSCLTF